jgi:guanylate kinase
MAKDDVVSIFLLPPSWDALEKRLHGRAQDSEEEIRKRLSRARDEISHYTEFPYVIINNDLKESVRQVQSILEAERARAMRFAGLKDFAETLKP